MNRKEFLIDNHKFIINYLKDESFLDRIDYNNDYRVITVTFQPNVLMLLADAQKIVDDNEQQIISQFKSVIEEHPEIYQHFEYELRLSGGGSSEGRINHQLYLIELEARIPLKIKEGVN